MALDFSHLFPPNTAEKKVTLLPAQPASEVKTGANGNFVAPWQQITALPSVLIPTADTLQKTQTNSIGLWQQTQNATNATLQAQPKYKFATPTTDEQLIVGGMVNFKGGTSGLFPSSTD